jgi:RHS repeat-associated protein
MAGISSKAAGKMDNKYEYKFYELNTDFDLNLYESFYRSQDPQIGRFLQIDPNPIISMEGLYNSMGNNPISNIDILGDITHYYNTSGDLLRSLEDGNKYATVNVIADEELDRFSKISSGLDKAQVLLKASQYAFSDVVKAILLNEFFGVKYDAKEFENYYDKHSKDYYEGDVFKPTDGKGKLVNEHMAGLKLENGYLRIMDKKPAQKGNNPVISGTDENGDADVHTHTSEGRSFSISGRPTHVGYGKDAIGLATDNDLSRRAWETPNKEAYRKGVFDVIVSPTHIYLYRNGQVVISVNRQNAPSKNSGEIK